MDTLYYDVYISIFKFLDYESLANLLNCNNKHIYNNLMIYIKQKRIYLNICGYDVIRFDRYFHQYDALYPGYPTYIIELGCNISVLKSLQDRNFLQGTIVLYHALQNGNSENVKWLLDNKCIITEDTFYTAVRKGIIDNMKLLKDYKCPYDYSVIGGAIQNGNIETIEWVDQNLYRPKNVIK